jgi:hypothetical protein
LAQGSDRNAKLRRHVPFGRQAFAVDQPTRRNIPDQQFADLHVKRQ